LTVELSSPPTYWIGFCTDGSSGSSSGKTEYFGADIQASPYLHFWSLSVEEQFYVAFPFVLLGLITLKRWWRPAVVVGIGALLAASLAAQLWWTQRDTLHAYYGTDSRLYQPMAGVLAAIAWRHLSGRRRALRRAGWPMLAGLLVVASSTLDLSQSTRGLLATVFSAGLVLTVMTRTTPSLDRVLSLPPLAYLGRISYGTYLWHWPVLLLVTSALDAPAWADALLTAAVATGLASLSFELLEQPIRTSARLAVSASPTILVGLTCSVLAAYGVVPRVLENDVRPALLSSSAPSASASAATAVPSVPVKPDARAAEVPRAGDPVPKLDWAALKESRGAETAYCTLADTTSCIGHVGTSGLHVMLVGDSHARVTAPTLLRIAQQRNFTLSYSMVPKCPWQEGVVATYTTPEGLDECREARNALYGGLLKKMKVDVVILTELPRSTGGWDDSLESLTGSKLGVDELNLSTMSASLRKIRSAGVKALVIDSWLQRYDGVDPLDCLSAARTIGQCAFTPGPPPLADAIVHTLAIAQVDVLQQPDGEHAGEHRRAAVRHERQGDAGDRHDPQAHADVLEGLEAEPAGDAGGATRPKTSSAARAIARARQIDDAEQGDQQAGADQAELLARDGEDEVGVLLGHEAGAGLRAVEEPLAEQPPLPTAIRACSTL
jgi:hypothetical protein